MPKLVYKNVYLSDYITLAGPKEYDGNIQNYNIVLNDYYNDDLTERITEAFEKDNWIEEERAKFASFKFPEINFCSISFKLVIVKTNFSKIFLFIFSNFCLFSKEKFSFSGWYNEESQPFDFSTVLTGNTTIYAKWNKILTLHATS